MRAPSGGSLDAVSSGAMEHEPADGAPAVDVVTALREQLGLDAIREQLDRIEEKLDAIPATRDFYTIPQAAAKLGKRKTEIEKLLADGVLWIVEGLDSTTRIIPQAALDELQRRPPARVSE